MTSPTLLCALALCALVPGLPSVTPSGTPGGMAAETQRKLRINLGTLAPKGSSYYQSLAKMGERWLEATDGKLKLVLYPDGRAGGESKMVQKMRARRPSLHAGLFTGVGLGEIERSVSGLQEMPMMFRDLDELEYVYRALRPNLERRLLAKGFVVLFWIDGGWVRLFSKEVTTTPEELKRRKLWVWSGATEQEAIMRLGGYHPVPLETAQVVTGLTTGLIDSAYLPPIFALKSQVDTRAGHMLELNYAPLIGAAVISKKAWDDIPAEYHAALLRAAQKAGEEIQAQSRKESEESVKAMVKRGLTVHPVTHELDLRWRAAAEELYDEIRGGLVPEDIFDQVFALVTAYRAEAEGERLAPPTGGEDK